MSSERDVFLTVTPEAERLLRALADNGLFGSTPKEVAERLLSEKLREIVMEGWLGVPGFPDGRTKPLIQS